MPVRAISKCQCHPSLLPMYMYIYIYTYRISYNIPLRFNNNTHNRISDGMFACICCLHHHHERPRQDLAFIASSTQTKTYVNRPSQTYIHRLAKQQKNEVFKHGLCFLCLAGNILIHESTHMHTHTHMHTPKEQNEMIRASAKHATFTLLRVSVRQARL